MYLALLYTADCSGDLEYATICGRGGVSCFVCAYNDSGDGVPNDAADTLIGCSNAIVMGATTSWETSSNKVTGSVTQGTSYWVVVWSNGDSLKVKKTAGSRTGYYGYGQAGDGASPPANLGNLASQTSNATYDSSCYIAIE